MPKITLSPRDGASSDLLLIELLEQNKISVLYFVDQFDQGARTPRRRTLLAPSLGLRVIFGTGTISGTSVLVNFCPVIRVELFR